MPTATTKPSLFVFDRLRFRHRWQGVLEAANTGDLTETAVRENWRMDGRVEEARESAILASIPFEDKPISFAAWKQQVEEYYSTLSCQIYADPTNTNNRIVSRTLPPHEKLVHVVSLGRLIRFLLKQHRGVFGFAWSLNFPDLPSLPLPGDLDYAAKVWRISENLNALGLPEVQRMAEFLSHHLGPSEPPWWAGFAADLHPYLSEENWLGLAQVLGLGHLQAGETLLVFQYLVNDALAAGSSCLFRPTAVEAGLNPYHFPGPDASQYGFTMPLMTGARHYCRELVHRPLKGILAAQACQRLLVRLGDDVLKDYDALRGLRAEHRVRLDEEWPDSASRAWLGRHSNAGGP